MTPPSPKENPKDRRISLRYTIWPKVDVPLWLEEDRRESGYMRAPRTLPLILVLLRRPELSGSQDPSPVYVELLSRHMGEGIVELTHEGDHAYGSGYTGTRAVRTWRDRMRKLEKHNFIEIKPKAGRKFGYALIIHPAIAVDEIRKSKKVDENWFEEWWQVYRARQIDTKEWTPTDLLGG